ncbi:MAG: LTA synthase family protein, partial [Haemophilus parainfluenzae]|nr:LTA synthase family protein [Haemophilus parainfluenzae]
MPTTLLSIAGVSGNYPMIGFDLTKDVNPDRAFMQFDQAQALMKGNHDVVIQTPNSKAKGYVYDKEKNTLTEKEVPEEMKKEALAHALLGSYLYKNRLYKGSEEK